MRAWTLRGRLVVELDLNGFVGTFIAFEGILMDALRGALQATPDLLLQELLRLARCYYNTDSKGLLASVLTSLPEHISFPIKATLEYPFAGQV
jgi:hypothetical protein